MLLTVNLQRQYSGRSKNHIRTIYKQNQNPLSWLFYLSPNNLIPGEWTKSYLFEKHVVVQTPPAYLLCCARVGNRTTPQWEGWCPNQMSSMVLSLTGWACFTYTTRTGADRVRPWRWPHHPQVGDMELQQLNGDVWLHIRAWGATAAIWNK